MAALLRPVTVGIVLGLVLGKQLGAFSAVWLTVKAGLCRRLEATSWRRSTVWRRSAASGSP